MPQQGGRRNGEAGGDVSERRAFKASLGKRVSCLGQDLFASDACGATHDK
jgi:hypothetical protein